MHPPDARGKQTYKLVQVLRAVAALMVVGHHAAILMKERMRAEPSMWLGSTSGVDVFFVISGLVMTISSEPLWRTAGAMRRFLLRRLERVVPLYWMVTTAKLLLLLLFPALAFNALGTVWHVVASYLFLPSLGPTGTTEPLVVVGWTLNLEMVFYVLFAIALGMRARLLTVLVPSLGALLLLSLWLPPMPVVLQGWAKPVAVEFLYGVLLGQAVLRRWIPSAGMSAGLMLAGFAVLWMTPWALPSVWRPVVWGMPAAAVVYGALGLEKDWGHRVPEWALGLGDASYAIYLTHGFVLPGMGLAMESLRISRLPSTTLVAVVAMVLSAGLGLVVFRLVELPITLWFKRRRSGIFAAA